MTPDTSAPKPSILLIGTDAAFLKTVEAALSQSRAVAVSAIAEPIEQAGKRPELDTAAVLVVAIDAKRRESLGALQALVGRLGGRVPVVVLTDSFDDALARWFLQIKVSDFLRKPVEPKEVLRACLRALRSSSSLPDDEGRILTFLAAAGGVGTTTLAIETALQLSRGARGLEPTCLVDLDFQGAACADYLDLDPRLDLDEIGPHPERLDLQLLDVMLARHASGLSLLAARGRPGERCTLDPEVVIRILDLVSSRFENVVIDLPRVWEPWTDQAARLEPRLCRHRHDRAGPAPRPAHGRRALPAPARGQAARHRQSLRAAVVRHGATPRRYRACPRRLLRGHRRQQLQGGAGGD
jgi:pilus assembly protein CpaE